MKARKHARATTKESQSLKADSIGAWIRAFYSDGLSGRCPFWPPDLFAIAGSLLRRTGAYRKAFETPATAVVGGKSSYSRLSIWREARRIGGEWRGEISRQLSEGDTFLPDCVPAKIQEWWQQLASRAQVSLGDFCDEYSGPRRNPRKKSDDLRVRDAVEATICLAVAADQACAAMGLERFDPKKNDDRFLQLAQERLEDPDNNFQSYCIRVPKESVCVLPKHHTPQTGLTIRSFSHHLALCAASEIETRWYGPFPLGERTEHLNMLLLPWPTQVRAKDFRLVPMARHPDVSHYQAFRFAPQRGSSNRNFLLWYRRALRKANALAGPIHAIVLPEVAIDLKEYTAAERIAVKKRAMLIAGVRLSASDTTLGSPTNACVIQTGGLFGLKDVRWNALSDTRFVQGKHHRWRLDRNQILQYELGSQLPASGYFWENIGLPPRSLQFVSLGSWMTWCALICEDLARQEPVAEVVRAVGPNLVIALLMDGPQLKERWSARYASVLADDPGTSVLAISNLGLVKRSQPPGSGAGKRQDLVIALWRDVVGGSREVVVSPGHDACVLSLVNHSEMEYSADGCRDARPGNYPVYAGHSSFTV